MNCTRAEQLISLHTGGDLQPLEAESLRQHVEACAQCREIAEEFAASQAWLSEFAVPSFDEAVFADLRASVLREIKQTESAGEGGRWFEWLLPKWNPQLAFVAMILLLLGAALVIYRYQLPSKQVNIADGPRSPKPLMTPSPSPPVEREQFVTENQTRPRSPKPIPQRVHSDTNHPVVAVKSPSTPTVAEKPLESAPTNSIGMVIAQAVPEREMLRIEMQTSDPNIRIIWFAPKPDNSPTDKTK